MPIIQWQMPLQSCLKMVLKSLRKKYDDFYHNKTNLVSMYLKKTSLFYLWGCVCDIMTYHFDYNIDIWHHLTKGWMNIIGSITHHVLSIVKNVGIFTQKMLWEWTIWRKQREEEKCTLWKSLMKDDVAVYPFIVNPKQSLGCQYWTLTANTSSDQEVATVIFR